MPTPQSASMTDLFETLKRLPLVGQRGNALRSAIFRIDSADDQAQREELIAMAYTKYAMVGVPLAFGTRTKHSTGGRKLGSHGSRRHR